jgi:hypothetical protein
VRFGAVLERSAAAGAMISVSDREERFMQLRSDPRMSSKHTPNWPPEWIWANGSRTSELHLKGEIGILENVRQSMIDSTRHLFLISRYLGGVYLGCLNFDDENLCQQIFNLLVVNCGHLIEEIGGIQIPF